MPKVSEEIFCMKKRKVTTILSNHLQYGKSAANPGGYGLKNK